MGRLLHVVRDRKQPVEPEPVRGIRLNHCYRCGMDNPTTTEDPYPVACGYCRSKLKLSNNGIAWEGGGPTQRRGRW